MRRITPATVTLGVLVSFVGLVGAYVIKDALRPRTPPPDIINNVMVALADFPADHVLSSEDIGRASLPSAQVPVGTIMDRQALVGRRLKQAVQALTPFAGNLFYPMGGGPMLSSKLKPGFRAVTIEATPVSAGVGGLVRPGDIVDILLTVDPVRQGAQVRSGSTMTLLQGIEVLAVDKNIDRGTAPTDPQQSPQSVSVTVAVSPDDANALVLAKDNGQLQLALRNPEEGTLNTTPRRWTLDELLGIEKPEEPTQEAPPKRFYAEIYRGTDHEELEFETEQVQKRRIPGAGTQGSPPGRVRRNSANQQSTPPTNNVAPPSPMRSGPSLAPPTSGGGRPG